MKKIILVIMSIIVIVFAEQCSDTLKFNTVADSSSLGGYILGDIFNEVCRRIDVCCIYRETPPARAKLWMQEGKLDADIARSYEYGENNPTVKRVPVSYLSTRFVAFAIDSSYSFNSWDNLRGKGLKINYLRSETLSSKKLNGIISDNYQFKVASIDEGMKRLIERHADIFICAEPLALGWFIQHPTLSKKIHLVGEMQKVGSYCYLLLRRSNVILLFVKRPLNPPKAGLV